MDRLLENLFLEAYGSVQKAPVVTGLPPNAVNAKTLYERDYCARYPRLFLQSRAAEPSASNFPILLALPSVFGVAATVT